MYRTLFYVNIYGSHKLLITVRFFGPPYIYTFAGRVIATYRRKHAIAHGGVFVYFHWLFVSFLLCELCWICVVILNKQS